MGFNILKKFLFKNLNYKFAKLTSSMNLKPKELIISQDSKCLCLCPHADDESIGMGGVLSIFGKNFDVVLLTDGRKGIKNLQTDEVVKIREEEFKCAMGVAGVNEYKFLHAEDKKLSDNFDLFKNIDLKKYDYIFVPNIIDQHPDHKAVSLLLKRLLDSDVNLETMINKNLQICFYEVWSTLGFVNSFVDISEVIETKKSMINCYKSQVAQKDYVYHALGLNQYRGMLKDKKYVEAFCILSVDDFKKLCNLY